jgi:hypothetical protein
MSKPFKVGDKVIGTGNPHDEQIEEEVVRNEQHRTKVQTVTDVMDSTMRGTSGQWIRTDIEHEWMDSLWYKPA